MIIIIITALQVHDMNHRRILKIVGCDDLNITLMQATEIIVDAVIVSCVCVCVTLQFIASSFYFYVLGWL